MSEATEREDLEALTSAPGWQRLVAHALEEYDRSVLDRITQVYDNPQNGDAMASDKLRQLLAVRREVRRLLDWPQRRVQDLGRLEKPQAPGLSRRGGL